MRIVVDIPIQLDSVYTWFARHGPFLGHVVAIFHWLVTGVILSLILVSHTIYPSIVLKVCIFLVLSLIWLQHVVFDFCILSVWETHLTTTHSPFHTLLASVLALVNISIQEYHTYMVLVEGTAVACFGLELLSYVFEYIQQ